jgi:hypothetical protein
MPTLVTAATRDARQSAQTKRMGTSSASGGPQAAGSTAASLFNPFGSLLSGSGATTTSDDAESLNQRLLRMISADDEEENDRIARMPPVARIPPRKHPHHAGSDNQPTSDDDDDERARVDENGILEWENPSYIVKDLDTGESYHVEQIDQQFNLVTLDKVAQHHLSGGSKYVTDSAEIFGLLLVLELVGLN